MTFTICEISPIQYICISYWVINTMYLMYLRCSVRPKRIVCVDGTDKTCCAWQQYIYIYIYIYISVYFHIYPTYYKKWRRPIGRVKWCGLLAVSIFNNTDFIYLLLIRNTQWRSLSKRRKLYESVVSVPRNYHSMFIYNPSSGQIFTRGDGGSSRRALYCRRRQPDIHQSRKTESVNR